MLIFLYSTILIISIFAVLVIFSVYKESKEISRARPIEDIYRECSFSVDYVYLDDISVDLKMIILGTEDNRFFCHNGVDYRNILYAFYVNVCSGRKKMGGSTITQQLAKNLYLSFEKTYHRKMVEFFLAFYIESRLSKRQILELYLNVIDYGKGQYGIKAASEYWFKKHPGDISINEALTLAALLPSPLKYNPCSEYGMFLPARHLALKKLKKYGLADDKMMAIFDKCGYDDVIDNDFVRNIEKFYADEFRKRQKI